jgi:hypothetical protein
LQDIKVLVELNKWASEDEPSWNIPEYRNIWSCLVPTHDMGKSIVHMGKNKSNILIEIMNLLH